MDLLLYVGVAVGYPPWIQPFFLSLIGHLSRDLLCGDGNRSAFGPVAQTEGVPTQSFYTSSCVSFARVPSHLFGLTAKPLPHD